MEPYKPNVSDIKALVSIGIAVLFDGLKLILFSLNGFVGIGTIIDIVASWIASTIENTAEYAVLHFSGAYKNGNSSSLALLAVTTVIGFVPLLDDFPTTTITVVLTILNSRKADKRTYAARAKAFASAANQQQDQEIRALAAQQAAERAASQREQAMRISQAAANDNTSPRNSSARVA